jgi:hypothetical protein
MYLEQYSEGPDQDWQPTRDPLGTVYVAGAVLGGQLSASSIIGTQGGHAPIQWWYYNTEGALQSSLTNNLGVGGLAAPFKPELPSSRATLLWPLYGANSSDTSQYQALFLGSAIDASLLGQPQPYLKLYNSITTINYSFEPNGGGASYLPFEWAPWREFSPALEDATGGVASLTACLLPGGGIQMFASDTRGQLWTIWQESKENLFAWISAWRAFPLPGGNRLPQLYIGSADFALPTLNRASLALGQNVTGELQLFAQDEHGALWTTWKTSEVEGAAWSDWARF